MSYRYASRAAASEQNIKNFGLLLDGIYKAGIRAVHIMTHSLGVQSLMNAFQNKDGRRSDVSRRFHYLFGNINLPSEVSGEQTFH